MMSSARVPPPASAGLKVEAELLYSWARSRGASHLTASRIVGLLSVRWLCAFPTPPRTHRGRGKTEAQWHRYLFRRHCGKLLGWTERLDEGNPEGFSDEVNRLIRERFYPDSRSEGNGARERGIHGESEGERPVAITKQPATDETEDGDRGNEEPLPGSVGGSEENPSGGLPCSGCQGAPTGEQPGPRRLPAWFTRGPASTNNQGKRKGPTRARS